MPEINENINMEEIRELEKQLAEKKAILERIESEKKEVELTKENVGEQFRQKIPVQQTTTIITDEEKEKEIKEDTKKLRNLDTARQVKVLIILAFEKGIAHSIKVARRLNDAYLLDELHDKLVGELRSELVEKGKLKDI